MMIVEILILAYILIGAIIGFKRGVIRSAIDLVGTIFIIIFSFYLKDPISIFLYEHMPFIDFGGVLSGISSFNIIFYEILAYIICVIVLFGALKIILLVSGLFDKLIKATVILALPSKILGAIFGALKYYLYAFVILFVFALMPLTKSYIDDSKVANIMLNNTPIMSNAVNNIYTTAKDIFNIKVNLTDSGNSDYESLSKLLDNDIISIDAVKKLVDENKLDFEGVTDLIKEYEEKEDNKND